MTEYNDAVDSTAITSVRLELRHCSVEISGGADTLGIETRPADALREYFEVSRGGGTLTIKQPPFQFSYPIRPTLILRLPSSVTDVVCGVGHGDVSVRSLRAALNARTGHGEVSVDSGAGVLEVHTGKGDVSVTVWDGPARLATGSGDLSVEVVSGDVTASTGRGDVSVVTGGRRVTLSTGHGDVSVGKLAGEAVISTGHGDITATELEGARITLTTGRGDVSLGGRLGGLIAKSGAGDYDIRCSLLPGEFDAQTAHGSISVHLPADTSARLDISTRRGKIDSNLPLVKVGLPGPESRHSRRYVANVGGENPQATMKLRTNHGDIQAYGPGDTASVSYEAGGDRGPDFMPPMDFGPAMSVAGEAIASAMRTASTATERAWEETMRQMRDRFPADFAPPMPPTPPTPPTHPSAQWNAAAGESGRPAGAAEAEAAESPADPSAPPEAPIAEAQSPTPAPAAAAQPAVSPEPAASASPPPAPRAAADTRVAILEAVSAGRISVDEGLALLSRLEAESRR